MKRQTRTIWTTFIIMILTLTSCKTMGAEHIPPQNSPQTSPPVQTQPLSSPAVTPPDHEENLENNTQILHHSARIGYSMVYDSQLFTLNEGEKHDTFQASGLYLSIGVMDDSNADEAIQNLRQEKGIECTGKIVSLGAHRYAATRLKSSDSTGEFYVTEQNGTVFLVELGGMTSENQDLIPPMETMLDTLAF